MSDRTLKCRGGTLQKYSILRIIPVAPRSFVFQLTPLVTLILSDNIPARSFALLTHRLRFSQPLAYIIARLRLTFSKLLARSLFSSPRSSHWHYPTIYPLARSLCSLTGFLPVSLSLILSLAYALPFRSFSLVRFSAHFARHTDIFRQYTRSLVRFAHSPASFQSASRLYYCSPTLRLLDTRTPLHYQLCRHFLLCIFILVSLFLFCLCLA